MKPWLVDLILFYMCFNLSVGIIWQLDILPNSYPPFQGWDSVSNMFSGGVTDILGRFITSPQGIGTIISGLLAGLGILTGSYLIAFGFLTLLALSFFAPIILSVFTGLPMMLTWFNVPSIVGQVLAIISGFIVFMFLIEYIGGRDIG